MSDLSKYQPDTPDHWHSQMADDTLRQVEKDFALHGVTLHLKFLKEDYPSLVLELADALEDIAFAESGKLPGILYQIDLDETELVRSIPDLDPAETYSFLADKILRRCFEKVYWRYKMRNK